MSCDTSVRAAWTGAEAIDRFHAAADHWRTQAFGWRSVVEKVTREWIGLIALNHLGPGIRGVDEDEIEVGCGWFPPLGAEGSRQRAPGRHAPRPSCASV